MLRNVNNIANGVTTTDQPDQSFEIILFWMAGQMAYSDDNYELGNKSLFKWYQDGASHNQ